MKHSNGGAFRQSPCIHLQGVCVLASSGVGIGSAKAQRHKGIKETFLSLAFLRAFAPLRFTTSDGPKMYV